MKEFKKLVLVISMLLMTSCGLRLQIGSANINTSKTQKVKVYTTTFQTIKNLDPWQLGLHSGGNWFLCRTHGFHDLNDWTDFEYSPVFCRSSRGFITGTRWNSSWNWNNNIWGHNRFDRFGFAIAWHFTNFFKDPYNTNFSGGYPISGNSGSPSKNGDGTYVFEDTIYYDVILTTMCDGKKYQDRLSDD